VARKIQIATSSDKIIIGIVLDGRPEQTLGTTQALLALRLEGEDLFFVDAAGKGVGGDCELSAAFGPARCGRMIIAIGSAYHRNLLIERHIYLVHLI
jgi:hypothetical protein